MHRAVGPQPLRGAEHASTSGRPHYPASSACRLRGRESARWAQLESQAVAAFAAATTHSCSHRVSSTRIRGPQRLRSVEDEASAVACVEEGWCNDDIHPHPSPPEDVDPKSLIMSECTVQELASEVQALVRLVQAQQDILYSQKAQIDQLTETLLEQAQRSCTASKPGECSQRHLSPFDSQRVGYGDRRLLGLYDARFHSTHTGATPSDFRVLPSRIILVRHAESEGNVDNLLYTTMPDSQVPLTARGHMQAREAGRVIKSLMEADPGRRDDYRLFFYISPYKRSLQTYEGISSQFSSHHLLGVQEEVQLREQDFGNFQDAEGKQHEKAERLRFGRFFYRFPNGESGADVYDRITLFEDHMVRDINAGRFAGNTALVLVTHGLALRIFLMRWFHWTVDEFLSVYNPANADPLVLERTPSSTQPVPAWRHTKSLYRLTEGSMRSLRGCSPEMCSTDTLPRKSLKVSTRLL
ncbi:hypothetical protein Agub_g1708 [Astrephomene gubernaculifera]|uniref:Phosphoglycerate mutase-like protein n=1 Tax=Astrephomene gubernaculifera TaxID=47775 RepID=A0AAD3DGC9_9CHLO|nr:hypothetical protein Agub_g1708 [Astrephomene gubernaculifera]